jgi:isoquinoline 1-oxidoreductase subunit beta
MRFIEQFARARREHTMTPIKLSRRDFLKATGAAGGGLMLGIAPSSSDAQEAKRMIYPPSAFLRIAPDGTTTIVVNRLEFGQGVSTALPMLLAEELDCEWNKVRAELAPAAEIYADPGFGIQVTGNSRSVATSWKQYRVIGASARAMLMAAAAQQWGIDPSKVDTRNGQVLETGGQKRRASYGSLAEAAAKQPVPTRIGLKADPADFFLIGRPTRRLDSREKVDGTAQFGLDKSVPNMRTAVLLHPPVFGGKVASFDPAKARAVKGVEAVVQVPVDRGGTGVAVIANGYWPAKMGRDALEVKWDAATGPTTAQQFQQYRELAAKPGLPAKSEGDPNAVAQAAKRIEAVYEFPYLAHAPMEPLNAVVDLKADSCTVWCGTQNQTFDQLAIARAAGLKPEQVTLNTMTAGGGFGRRAIPTSDYLVEAVNIARAMKQSGVDAPVKVVWSREDDIRGGYYRPLVVHRVVVGLDAGNSLRGWNHTIVGQSIVKGTPLEGTPLEKYLVKDGVDSTTTEGLVDTPYRLPNLQVSVHHPEVNVPVLWWRSVGHSHTAFVIETTIDELARAAKQDPIAYRLALLDPKHTRVRTVLQLVRDKSGWATPVPKGRARGVAMHESFGSVVAYVVEVSVDKNNIRVHKVTSAIDCGTPVNPMTIEAQVQSGTVFGLSAALYGQITLKDGVVQQTSFADYPILRLDAMPEMAVHIVPSRADPSGVGEPGVPPIAPAVANAVFALTGKRVRKLPFDLAQA